MWVVSSLYESGRIKEAAGNGLTSQLSVIVGKSAQDVGIIGSVQVE